jgi:hypothetical protein
MNKIISYAVAGIISFCALMPPVGFNIPNPNSMMIWTALITFAGFAGLLLSFTKVNIFVKIIAIGGFINCFFSSAPVISFNSYIPLLACCYFYLLCTKIKDWQPIFNVLFAILIYECIFIFIQFLRADTLLNFSFGGKSCWGTVGNKMQLESFLIILSAFLISKINWKIALGIIVLAILFNTLYGLQNHLWQSLMFRLPVWKKTIQLANLMPFMGWGISSYKILFPVLGKASFTGAPFMHAHNDWLQVLFETGRIGFGVMVSIFMFLFYKLLKAKKWRLLVGMIIISLDMCVHFPTREIQCVFIMIAFLAFCEKEIKYG